MIIDQLDSSIQLKIVYFGPALSGKTTSLRRLFDHFGNDLISIESSVNRTLFFDYGTVAFQNDHWLIKIHVYSTTGQDFYVVTRPVTLRAVDGIIFVADSQESAYERNIISWEELKTYFGNSFDQIPKVVAFNKQDLPYKFSPIKFLEEIGYDNYSKIDAKTTIAVNGEGILESFESVLNLIFKDLYKASLVSSLKEA